MTTPRKNIVVVGGGYAGVFLVKRLSQTMHKLPDHHIIFITGRDFFYHIIGAVRANMARPATAEQICMPYEGLVADKTRITYVHQRCNKIYDSHLELADGTSIDFAYCVITTGKKWFDPLSVGAQKDEAVRQMTEYHAKLEAARHIVIVGGGGVGIEMAGELAETWPPSTGKTISLIHRRPQLLNDALCDKFRNGLADRLRAMGVHLYLNDELDPKGESGRLRMTKKGNLLENVDIVIRATQCQFNADLLEELVPDLITGNGVAVKGTFQLEGFDKIFVMGDLADLPEQRSAMKHRGHAITIIANILAQEGQGAVRLYRPTIEAMLVSLGSHGGMATINIPWIGPCTFGNWLAWFKAKDVYIGKLRAFMGLK